MFVILMWYINTEENSSQRTQCALFQYFKFKHFSKFLKEGSSFPSHFQEALDSWCFVYEDEFDWPDNPVEQEKSEGVQEACGEDERKQKEEEHR